MQVNLDIFISGTGHIKNGFESKLLSIKHFLICSNVLISASVDSSITLWNFSKFTGDCNLEEVNVTHNPGVRTDSTNIIIANFRTKDSPVLGIHVTRRNLLIGVGASEV